MILYILILSIPLALELYIETKQELRHKKEVSHFWSAVVRGVLMIICAQVVTTLEFGVPEFQKLLEETGRAFIMSVAIHFTLFDYSYNKLTGRKLSYTRGSGIDLIWEQVGWLGVAFFRLIFLLFAIQLYFKIWY